MRSRLLRKLAVMLLVSGLGLLAARVTHPGIKARHLGSVGEAFIAEDGQNLIWVNGQRIHMLDRRTGESCDYPQTWRENASPDGTLVAHHRTSWHGRPEYDYLTITAHAAKNCGTDTRIYELDSSIEATAFSPDNQRLAAALSRRREAHPSRLLMVHRDDQQAVFERPLSESAVEMRFSPDGALLATGGANALVTVLDAHTGDLRWQLELLDIVAPSGVLGRGYYRAWEATELRFSADGRYLAVGLDRGDVVAIIDMTEGDVVRLLQSGDLVAIESLAFHPHEPWLAAGMETGRVVLWDVESGKELGRRNTEASLLKTMHPIAFIGTRTSRILNGSWNEGVRAVGFDDDGETLLAVAHNRLFSWPL